MPITEQVYTILAEVLNSHTEEDVSEFDVMLRAMADALKPLLKSDEEALDCCISDAVEALNEDNLVLTARIAELEHALKKANAELKAAKKEKPAAKATVAKATASKSKTKSGGDRKANPYSSFMSVLKHVANVAEIAEIEVTADPQFSATALKSKGRYDEHRDQILHDGQPLHGQTVTLQQAYDSITAASEIDPLFKNAAVRTAILWAMLSAEQRKEVLRVGRENELCR